MNNQVKNLNEIEFDSLSELLSTRLNWKVDLKGEINEGKLTVKTENLSEHAGIMDTLYETLNIESFGSGVETKDGLYLWVPLNFMFTYKSGGSNGVKICDAFWNFKEKNWTIK